MTNIRSNKEWVKYIKCETQLNVYRLDTNYNKSKEQYIARYETIV